jgi:hypothetical protein
VEMGAVLYKWTAFLHLLRGWKWREGGSGLVDIAMQQYFALIWGLISNNIFITILIHIINYNNRLVGKESILYFAMQQLP